MALKVNLGCSDQMYPNSINVDHVRPANADESYRYGNLCDVWRFEDSSVDHFRAHDIIEHLPDKIHTMNEAWRCLKPSGTFDIFVPTTDGRGAFQDPTHVSYWNANSFFYFVDVFAEWQRFHEGMGVTARFRIPGCPTVESAAQYLEEHHAEYPGKVWKLRITLEAVK